MSSTINVICGAVSVSKELGPQTKHTLQHFWMDDGMVSTPLKELWWRSVNSMNFWFETKQEQFGLKLIQSVES